MRHENTSSNHPLTVSLSYMNTLRWETSNARVSTQKFTDEVKYYRHPELSNSVQLSQLHYAIYIDTGTSIDKLLTCTASVYHLRRKNPRRQITTTIYRQPVTETALHRLANGSSNRLRTPPLKPAELHSVEFIRHTASGTTVSRLLWAVGGSTIALSRRR